MKVSQERAASRAALFFISTLLPAVVLIVAVASPAMLNAASFQVTPVRAILDARNDNTFFEFENTDTEEVSVQVEIMKWSQEDGEDILENTGDFVIVPRIITLDPDARQVVRLGLLSAPQSDIEATYRIFFTEIRASDEPATNNVSMRLRVSIPVFVNPETLLTPSLQLSDVQTETDHTALEFYNNGNQHIQVLGIRPKGATDEQAQPLNTYILPGNSKQIAVELPDFSSVQMLEVDTDVAGILSYELAQPAP